MNQARKRTSRGHEENLKEVTKEHEGSNDKSKNEATKKAREGMTEWTYIWSPHRQTIGEPEPTATSMANIAYHSPLRLPPRSQQEYVKFEVVVLTISPF
jgi:hypothetical protein